MKEEGFRCIEGLNRPFGIHSKVAENLYIVDLLAGRILVYNSRTLQPVSQIDGLSAPHAIVQNSNGHLLITEYGGRCVTEYSQEGHLIRKLIDRKSSWPSWILAGPMKTLLTKSGDLVVCDFLSDCIHRFSQKGDWLGYLGGRDPGWRTQMHPEPPASGHEVHQFNRPHGITFDDTENFYVSDLLNHRFLKFDATGNSLGWCGMRRDDSLTSGFSMTDEAKPTILPGAFISPVSIDFDNKYLAICDHIAARVNFYNKDGRYLGFLGGTHWDKACRSPSSERWTYPGPHPGQFYLPYEAELTGSRLYVADTNNHRVQIIEIEGLSN